MIKLLHTYQYHYEQDTHRQTTQIQSVYTYFKLLHQYIYRSELKYMLILHLYAKYINNN